MTPTPPRDSFPIMFQDGRFLPAQDATVSIFDRGLLYGDGLFETLRLHDGLPLSWDQHLERLREGANFLRIPIPQSPTDLRNTAIQLSHLNQASAAMLRLTLTRGIGPRGYAIAHAIRPTLFMSLHPAPSIDPRTPPQWRLVTSRIRLCPDDPLTRFKTCNRLPYILARQDAETAQVHDALMLNTRGEVAETSTANIFWLRRDCLGTTPLDSAALPGITRANVLGLAQRLGLTTHETSIAPADLFSADAVFLTVTSLGIIEVTHLDQCPLARSPLVQSLYSAYWQLASPLRSEVPPSAASAAG
jgi:branched-chain amino acid aminotransferase